MEGRRFGRRVVRLGLDLQVRDEERKKEVTRSPGDVLEVKNIDHHVMNLCAYLMRSSPGSGRARGHSSSIT